MKFTQTTVKTALGAAGIAAAGVFSAAAATAAPPTTAGFGVSEKLVDGTQVTNYTVSNLQPSNVTIPGYTPQGRIYQANVTAKSTSGTVTPLVSDFNARAGTGGPQYRLINTVPVPNGLSPTPITEGNQNSGKLYFDVTGPPPTEVVYNDGVQDVLIWS